MHVIHVYSIPKRGERIEIACPSSRVCILRKGETGWERTERDEQVKGRRPRTNIHTHGRVHPPRERATRRTKGGGEGRHGGGIYYSGFTVITRRERTTPQRATTMHTAWGVFIRYVQSAHTYRISTCATTHGPTDAGHIVGMSRHQCIPSLSDLWFVALPFHACITSRVIERRS